MKIPLRVFVLWFWVGSFAPFISPVRAAISLPNDAPEFVRWAATDVQTALAQAGLSLADARVKVVIGSGNGIEAQGFELSVDGTDVSIAAGGPLGAMYGLQELAEQIGGFSQPGDWPRLLAHLQPGKQHPFLEMRADNMFIHVYPLQLNDLDFWRAYIDMLARNRFNWLDLHGAYDLQSTSFPNLYPMLVHVPEYPQVGNEQEQARNLASFKAIIAYAKSRGVQVAFMNYSANDGRGGAEKNAPSVTGVPPEKLADYTARAVARLIRELPDLAMLGFRVGESGQDAAFYKDSYLRGVVEGGRPDLRLYTRSWQTTKEQLVPLAQVARAGFDIEVKFNGEHLGLPYHALQTKFGTYSYEGYLDVPADYHIIWQVRANGTHRFWAWEDTNFIRRTIRTLALGDARGFTLEPPVAYFNTDPAAYYRSETDRAVFSYQWQKHWMWYFAWGRLAYDPELPEKRLQEAYARHFGAAGATVYAAMQQMCTIVPLVYAYRFPGPDHRDFSPETESGNVSAKRSGQIPLLLQFIDNHPEDERSFAGIGAFLDAKLQGVPDGRVGPLAVAARLKSAAERTRELAAAVPTLTGAAAGEWNLLRADLLSASELADYYANRLTALTHFGYALRRDSEADYRIAIAGLAASRAAWQRLAQIADATYRPLSNPLRKQVDFQWASQLPVIERTDAQAPELWAKREKRPGTKPLEFTPAERGEDVGWRLGQLTHAVAAERDHAIITCRVEAPDGTAGIALWFKALPSQLTWQKVEMTAQSDGTFSATVPLTSEGLMYHIEARAKSGAAKNFPDVFVETPYRVIPAFAPGK